MWQAFYVFAKHLMTSKPGACIHSEEGFKAIFDQKTKNVMTSHPNPLDDYRKVPAGASCLMLCLA